jgi:hypothetical protein
VWLLSSRFEFSLVGFVICISMLVHELRVNVEKFVLLCWHINRTWMLRKSKSLLSHTFFFPLWSSSLSLSFSLLSFSSMLFLFLLMVQVFHTIIVIWQSSICELRLRLRLHLMMMMEVAEESAWSIALLFIHLFVYVIFTCFGIGTKAHLGWSEARFCTNPNLRRNLCMWFLHVLGLVQKLTSDGQRQGFVPIPICVKNLCMWFLHVLGLVQKLTSDGQSELIYSIGCIYRITQ